VGRRRGYGTTDAKLVWVCVGAEQIPSAWGDPGIRSDMEVDEEVELNAETHRLVSITQLSCLA
jgi:hypothetical protein